MKKLAPPPPVWSSGAVRMAPGCQGEETSTQARALVSPSPPSLPSVVRSHAPAVCASTAPAAPTFPSSPAPAPATTMAPGAMSVPLYRVIHFGGSSATAPPPAVVASSEQASTVGVEAFNGSAQGGSKDGKMAVSGDGSRKRGLKRKNHAPTPAVCATTAPAASLFPLRTAVAATMPPGAMSVPMYRLIHCGGPLATAPPVVASSEPTSTVGVEACNGSGQGGATDGKTAVFVDGPRKWGVKRRWKAGVGPDSRAFDPGRISPLEEALRQYGDRGAGPIIAPRAGLEFDSCEEAFDYYNLYSWEMGFGIRYSTTQAYKKHGETYRNRVSFVCVRAGTPDPGIRNSIKQGCPARMRLLRTDDHGWYIKIFVADHNHRLSETCGEQKCWKSHKQIDPHTKQLIKNLRANNASLTNILSSFSGNNNLSAVTKRALRSLTVQVNREVEDNVQKPIEDNVRINREEAEDDVQKITEVFNRLHEEVEGFTNVIDLDDDGNIKTLMWTNGKSRHDYLCFGDAITFDTTYRTNKYNMPFGIFTGVNKHFQSVIFAGVLMLDESIKSFEWVFTQFVALMGGKVPETILTDQCRAMEVALANKFPKITHKWCKWHVFHTIKTELGQKYTKEFKKELNKICNDMLTPEEFEDGWNTLLMKHGLKNNEYMSNIYDNRHRWAKAYFSMKFCAKQTSTQRSESANHMLKGFVSPGATMHVFVEQYHKLLSELTEKEDGKEDEDKMPLAETSTGWPIESHAAEFYTKTMLSKFVDHMKQGAKYDVAEIVPRRKYRLDHVDPSSREKWYRESYMVDIREDGGYYQCECGMWEHMGIRVVILSG